MTNGRQRKPLLRLPEIWISSYERSQLAGKRKHVHEQAAAAASSSGGARIITIMKGNWVSAVGANRAARASEPIGLTISIARMLACWPADKRANRSQFTIHANGRPRAANNIINVPIVGRRNSSGASDCSASILARLDATLCGQVGRQSPPCEPTRLASRSSNSINPAWVWAGRRSRHLSAGAARGLAGECGHCERCARIWGGSPASARLRSPKQPPVHEPMSRWQLCHLEVGAARSRAPAGWALISWLRVAPYRWARLKSAPLLGATSQQRRAPNIERPTLWAPQAGCTWKAAAAASSGRLSGG